MDVDDDREAGGLFGAHAANDPEVAIADQMSGQWEFLLESLFAVVGVMIAVAMALAVDSSGTMPFSGKCP